MRWISICCVFTILSTIASSYQISTVRSEEFNLEEFLEDFIYMTDTPDELMGYYDYVHNNKRDEESFEDILLKFNESQILFKGLDALSDSKTAQELIVNATAFLIKGIGNVNLTSLLLSASSLHLNVSGIFDTVRNSGLVESTLDGILLDESYRPVLVNLVERIVYPNLDTIYFLMTKYLHSASNKKRADTSNSLETFAMNIISTFLSSELVADTSTDLLNALNDTGVAVYTIKRLIASEQYQNLTVSLVKDIYATGAIKINLSSLNITAIIDSVLDNPLLINRAISGILSGGSNLGSTFGKYTGAIREIIGDLEDDGFFLTLNNYLFSSSTSTTSASSKNERKNGSNAKGALSKSKATSTADSSAHILTPAANPIYKLLFIVQSVILGGLLF